MTTTSTQHDSPLPLFDTEPMRFFALHSPSAAAGDLSQAHAVEATGMVNNKNRIRRIKSIRAELTFLPNCVVTTSSLPLRLVYVSENNNNNNNNNYNNNNNELRRSDDFVYEISIATEKTPRPKSSREIIGKEKSIV